MSLNAPKQSAAARLAAAASLGPIPVNRPHSTAIRAAVQPYPPRNPPVRVEAAGTGSSSSRDAAEDTRETIRREREQAGGVSTRETKASRYTRRLQEGLNPTGTCHIPGIMAKKSAKGEILLPYEHQRHACSMACVAKQDVLLLAHDAGTGKTATFFQIFAALELVQGGGATAIVTCPPSTLAQWEQTAHDWLNLPDKRGAILVTNQQQKLTKQVLERVRVLVITRHLLAKLYKQCWYWEKEHEKTATGHWSGAWVIRPGVPLHPIWEKKWSVLGIDEVCIACY